MLGAASTMVEFASNGEFQPRTCADWGRGLVSGFVGFDAPTDCIKKLVTLVWTIVLSGPCGFHVDRRVATESISVRWPGSVA